jgi:hypothetical protein
MKQRHLIPVPKWPNHHDWPSVAALRSIIFNSKSNGFEKAFRRVGRRVLVDEQAFFECIDQLGEQR